MKTIEFGLTEPQETELKAIQIEVEGEIVFGWIDINSNPIYEVQIFSTDEKGELAIPLDGIYIIPEYSYSIEVISGIIQ
tara:strand:+ start:200 stop:436 length:237 start_codon:yes stop_codon:yes gene_type:complete